MENTERSLNGDLNEGQTDGKYRKAHKDRGGLVEPTTDLDRVALHPWYGYGYPNTQAPVQVLPGTGRPA